MLKRARGQWPGPRDKVPVVKRFSASAPICALDHRRVGISWCQPVADVGRLLRRAGDHLDRGAGAAALQSTTDVGVFAVREAPRCDSET